MDTTDKFDHCNEPATTPAGRNSAGRARRMRVALYSHDTMGIGHIRRNLSIAQTLSGLPYEANVLMIAGAHEANVFAMPPRVDCLTVPSLYKTTNGEYESRRLRISLAETVELRANVIGAAIESFDPDVLIVDKAPLGALNELRRLLKSLRSKGRTRCVLGLRDVLDDPSSVRREWRQNAFEDSIREHYDAVWVYGDKKVYDPVSEYRFSSDIAAKVRYTGYLDQRARLELLADEELGSWSGCSVPQGRFVLGVMGGGQDGACLASALAETELPADTHAILVTGPFMSRKIRDRLCRQAIHNPRLQVLGFVPEADLLMSRADRVISMGGYNTICSALSFEKRTLVVPRIRPRREQLIRAERLRDLGLIDMLHPDDLTPGMLGRRLKQDFGQTPSVRNRIDLNGLARIPLLLEEVLAKRADSPRHPHEKGSIHHVAH